MPRAPSPNSFDSQIARRVRRSPPGRVFTAATFAGLGSRASIDKALQRQVAAGNLRRLSRGLYDKPRTDPLLGTLWPTVDEVVKAFVGKSKLRVQPAGAYAANLLGLSEQVPARIVMLTDGASRSLRAGPMRIELRQASPRNMAAAGRLSGLVIQAFKSLGSKHLTPDRIRHLRRTIPRIERRKLLADLDLAPGWMWQTLRELARDEPKPARQNGTQKAKA